MNKKAIRNLFLLSISLVLFVACDDDESYSDRLNIEQKATNAFLATQRVEMDVPADSVFLTGYDAPYYRIDPDGNVYMQVLDAGDRASDKPRDNQTIYFRFTRYNLISWQANKAFSVYQTNEADMSAQPTFVQYQNFTLPTSSQWGYGLQLPMTFLGAECEVNLVIKSQYGMTDEISYVQPYLFHVRYFHSQI